MPSPPIPRQQQQARKSLGSSGKQAAPTRGVLRLPWASGRRPSAQPLLAGRGAPGAYQKPVLLQKGRRGRSARRRSTYATYGAQAAHSGIASHSSSPMAALTAAPGRAGPDHTGARYRRTVDATPGARPRGGGVVDPAPTGCRRACGGRVCSAAGSGVAVVGAAAPSSREAGRVAPAAEEWLVRPGLPSRRRQCRRVSVAHRMRGACPWLARPRAGLQGRGGGGAGVPEIGTTFPQKTEQRG